MKIDLYKNIIEKENLPKLTDAEIENFESTSKLVLPQDFLNCLLYQNRADLKVTMGYKEDENFWIKSIPGINSNNNNVLINSSYYIDEWNLPKKILLIYGEGHWWVCFDYRNLNSDGTPKISLIDVEMNKDEILADSFGEFLKLLEIIEGV